MSSFDPRGIDLIDAKRVPGKSHFLPRDEPELFGKNASHVDRTGRYRLFQRLLGIRHVRQRHDSADAHQHDLSLILGPFQFADQGRAKMPHRLNDRTVRQPLHKFVGHCFLGEIVRVKIAQVLVGGQDVDVKAHRFRDLADLVVQRRNPLLGPQLLSLNQGQRTDGVPDRDHDRQQADRKIQLTVPDFHADQTQDTHRD